LLGTKGEGVILKELLGWGFVSNKRRGLSNRELRKREKKV